MRFTMIASCGKRVLRQEYALVVDSRDECKRHTLASHEVIGLVKRDFGGRGGGFRESSLVLTGGRCWRPQGF